ncbi:MAG: class II fructose-bisphosphate aldolase [Lachnospiraceae bacterium]|nr:class II fructose-bisphosphate aldolase [Lachnospiraceae bacterium]
MLVTLNEVMKIAEEKQIAIGSFNTPNLESIRAVIGAAEEEKLPVVIMFAECHDPWIPLDEIGPVMIGAAQRAKVPVCVHLDHGETLDYLEKALSLGFASIMYDGSVLPYEENVSNTKKAVEMAKKSGASVEAELGSMGRRESGAGDQTGEDDETKIYTDPNLATKFISETGIDALACSFGTTHGIYLTEPKLDFDVVRNVRKLTDNIPVVMHGGSGVSREDYHEAVKAGVRKINYFTYLDKSGGTAVCESAAKLTKEEPAFFSSFVLAATKAMKENARAAMRMFALAE